MQQFPNGTIFSVSTVLAAAIALSAISNADPAVAAAVAPPVDGSIGILFSNWTGINERVIRSDGADSNSFELEGLDTTDVQIYDGVGAGSFVPVTTWVQISQVTNVGKTGGEQQFYTWQYLEDRDGRQRQKPTFKNAKSITLTLDYDPALAWYDALSKANDVGDGVVLRAVLPNGVELYYYVYPSFDDDPSMTINENMQNTATFSLIGKLTRYEGAA